MRRLALSELNGAIFLGERGSIMSFQILYDAFLQEHLNLAAGERKRRLRQGLGYAEKLFLEQIWFIAIGHFKDLHPEYEVKDFKDGSRFLDFAYLRKPYRICIEIDGFGPHYRDLNRWGFIDQTFRQNDLIVDRWLVFRFPVDAMKEQPRRCQQYLQQIMGSLYKDSLKTIDLSPRKFYCLHLVSNE
jgi:hypothetical protein